MKRHNVTIQRGETFVLKGVWHAGGVAVDLSDRALYVTRYADVSGVVLGTYEGTGDADGHFEVRAESIDVIEETEVAWQTSDFILWSDSDDEHKAVVGGRIEVERL